MIASGTEICTPHQASHGDEGVDHEQVQRDAELHGVYLLVAGGKATTLTDADILAEWKGQHKMEHCFRLMNQIFLVAPLFLKTPRRIAALVFLMMAGALVAGLIERQVRRVIAKLQQPIKGLMPEGRDTLRLYPLDKLSG
jgi:transposase